MALWGFMHACEETLVWNGNTSEDLSPIEGRRIEAGKTSGSSAAEPRSIPNSFAANEAKPSKRRTYKLTLAVFYDERQTVTDPQLISPSAGKPALVMKEWETLGYDIEIMSVNPASRDDFYLAHARTYVDGVFDLTRPNGFGTRTQNVADSLPWTTGSMITAAVYALEKKTIACSPSSGYHHAMYDMAGGFCTFNGLMVTAVKLHHQYNLKRVGILDIDHHYGDGTDHIIRKIDAQFVRHYSFGGDHRDNSYWKGGPKADEWLEGLPSVLADFSDCQLVIYQASADPHMNDPLGGALSSAQMRKRDELVFSAMRKHGIPLVWNIAGGYQNPIENVLAIHNATMEECLKAFELPIG